MTEIKATLIDSMGSDLTVVNAARVSFAKESAWEWDGSEDEPHLSERDQKLIRFLAREGHWSPFAHPQASFHVKAPLFVARQLAKHQVGFAWNEVSRRYVDAEPEFYTPEVWRSRAEDKKQGSGGPHDEPYLVDGIAARHYEESLSRYQLLIDMGVAPEQARMVLPLATMTEWIWTGSLAAWARMCRERLAPDSQRETAMVAEQVAAAMSKLFPVSWPVLVGQRG